MMDKAKGRRLAKAIKPPQKYSDAPPAVKQGLVIAIDLPTGTCTVLLAGATTPVSAMSVTGWLPGIGEVVWVLQKEGATVVLGSMLRTEWLGPWNAPWGIVPGGFVEPSAISGVTAGQDLTGMTVTFSAIANRCYFIKAAAHTVTSSVSGDIAEMTLADGGGSFGPLGRCTANTSANAGISLEWVRTYSTGTVTVKAQGRRASGTGSLTYSTPLFSVEDIGPSTNTP